MRVLWIERRKLGEERMQVYFQWTCGRHHTIYHISYIIYPCMQKDPNPNPIGNPACMKLFLNTISRCTGWLHNPKKPVGFHCALDSCATRMLRPFFNNPWMPFAILVRTGDWTPWAPWAPLKPLIPEAVWYQILGVDPWNACFCMSLNNLWITLALNIGQPHLTKSSG